MSAPWSRPGLALVAGAALVLSGCGVLSQAGDRNLPSVPVATQDSASAGSDRPTAPKGSRWVIATHSGIQLVGPSTWKTVDWAATVKNADRAELAALAKSMNYTVAEVTAESKNMDLLLMAPSGSSAGSNISVVLKPSAGLPSTPALAKALTAHKSTVTRTWSVKTAVGHGVAMTYRVALSGKALYGESVFLKTDKGFVTIDVTCLSAAAVQKIAKPLLSSLRRANL